MIVPHKCFKELILTRQTCADERNCISILLVNGTENSKRFLKAEVMAELKANLPITLLDLLLCFFCANGNIITKPPKGTFNPEFSGLLAPVQIFLTWIDSCRCIGIGQKASIALVRIAFALLLSLVFILFFCLQVTSHLISSCQCLKWDQASYLLSLNVL